MCTFEILVYVKLAKQPNAEYWQLRRLKTVMKIYTKQKQKQGRIGA